MKAKDVQRLAENYAWFNQFFSDLQSLMEKIAEATSEIYDYSAKDFYYPKSNGLPYIPVYYMMGLGGKGKAYALQIFAVIDPEIITVRKGFVGEPSFIVVKHSRPERYLYLSNYGERVIWNEKIEVTSSKQGVTSGIFSEGASKGDRFQAFQVTFDSYIGTSNTKHAIQHEFVNVLKKLPALKTIVSKGVSK